MADPLDCALDLMRRLPPSQTEQNLSDLIGESAVAAAGQMWFSIL